MARLFNSLASAFARDLNYGEKFLSGKVLIIGLDGMTFNFIDPLISAGRLPTIAKIMKEGLRSPLETIFPPITSVAWTSFITGKNPGKHGILEFIQRRRGQARETAANATQRSGK